MATMEAKERGFDEALMLEMNGFVAEGPGANFFYEKDGVLYTPPLGSILPGITRQTVMEICRELDIPVQEKYFRPEDLFEADCAFFCGTAAEITPIDSIEGQTFEKPWKKSLGVVIQEAYQSIVLDKSYSYVIV
jgi:branched-chain amino acid aminotransferase